MNHGLRRGWRSPTVSYQLLHQADQILLVEYAGAVRAGVEESPHPALLLDSEENELFLDQVLLQQLLVKARNRPRRVYGTRKSSVETNPVWIRTLPEGSARER